MTDEQNEWMCRMDGWMNEWMSQQHAPLSNSLGITHIFFNYEFHKNIKYTDTHTHSLTSTQLNETKRRKEMKRTEQKYFVPKYLIFYSLICCHNLHDYYHYHSFVCAHTHTTGRSMCVRNCECTIRTQNHSTPREMMCAKRERER